MSVTLKEVLESAGYDLSKREDAQWFVNVSSEIDELMIAAEELLDEPVACEHENTSTEKQETPPNTKRRRR